MQICFYVNKWNYLDNYKPVINHLTSNGIKYFVLYSCPANIIINKHKQKHTLVKLNNYNKIKSNFFFGELISLLLIKKQIKKIFNLHKTTTLILSDDRDLISGIIIKIANKFGIKILLYPIEAIQLLSVRKLIKQSDRYKDLYPLTLKNKLLDIITKKIYKQNFLNNNIKFTSNKTVLYGKILNILPKNPWIRGTNSISINCVNSEIQKSENLKICSNLDNQIVTGFPPHDTLQTKINNKDKNKKKVKFLLKTKYLNHILIIGTNYKQLWKNNFINYSKITNSIIEETANIFNKNYNIIYKIHPSISSKEQIQMLKKKLPSTYFTKNKIDVYTLIAASDLVVLFISSTVMATLATNNPIIAYNLGILHFDTFFKNFSSIKTADSIDEYKKELSNYMSNNLNLSKTEIIKRRHDRNLYGKFMGENTKKILSLIK